MTRRRSWPLAVIGLTVLLAPLAAAAADDKEDASVRIGLVTSLFRDVPAPMVEMAKQPFQTLMRDQTGLQGNLVVGGDALALGKQLDKNRVQIGVFHGVEFAWAQAKYPDLRPLMLAVNRQRHLYANVVVRADSAAGFADLKGQKLSLPRLSREHCHLFLNRLTTEAGGRPATFFAKIVEHPNVEDALDDVLRGKVQAAVVDSVSMECYGLVKPGCHARLKVLTKSEVFPAAVIAYRHGSLDAATLKTFRDGMINANQTARGRDLMALWKLTAFEPIPEDFQQTLDNIRRAYPDPGALNVTAPHPNAAPAPNKKK
jgi:ABC-type phosphate/phosphonate transport system substrate-binding protein